MKIQEERVLLLVEENGITQRKMAQDLAISPTTLNGYLRGKCLHVPDDADTAKLLTICRFPSTI